MGNCCRLLTQKSSKKYHDDDDDGDNDESENNSYDVVGSSPGGRRTNSKKSSSRKKSSVASSKKSSNGNVHGRVNLSDTSLNNNATRVKTTTSISGSKNRLIESGNTLNTIGLTNSGVVVAGPAALRATLSYENRLDENIPHIADFFAEDDSTVPTDNPRIQTLFLPRAKANMQESQKNHRAVNENSFFHNSSDNNLNAVKRHNSCSTIFVDDSTVSQPNLKSAIRLVACSIYCLIQTRKSDNVMDIFDEKLYPISKDSVVPDDYDKIVPDQRYIYKFMKNLFVRAQLTAECAIVTLVYLERVLVYGELDLCPSNWKRLLLGAVILASKVWDDQAVWNVDFCQILQDINVENMNELERQYLNLLQFNTNVPSSVYAKYYFDLRQLAELYNLTFPHKQLTKEKALKLEAMSSVCQEKYKRMIEMQIKNARRTASTDNLYSPSRKSLVIIS